MYIILFVLFFFFFFNDTATTEIYTLSLHDALPISVVDLVIDRFYSQVLGPYWPPERRHVDDGYRSRSEEHTSELQSQSNLVCRLLLEKKKKKQTDKQLLNRSLYTLTTYNTVPLTYL